jgi:tetratricopeptide (TPR) repeat protein
MSDVLVGALSVLLATNPPAALTNLVLEKTGLAALQSRTNDPVARELQMILDADDAAQEEIDRWIEEAEPEGDPAAQLAASTLRGRIQQRIEPVRKRYREFLAAHPTNATAHLAFGSFLNSYGDEPAAIESWEQARRLDPRNPAAWNNLANAYAHSGPVEKSFPMFEEAIRLNPVEPVYLHNYGTLVFMFRRDATNHFKCDEQEVFQKAFGLYQKAIALDPNNFQLAADVAQTYYGWRLPRSTNAVDTARAELELATTAMKAWTNALALAPNDVDREGVQLHFARWNIRLGRLEDASQNLSTVTNAAHSVIRKRLEKTLKDRGLELSRQPAQGSETAVPPGKPLPPDSNP